MKWWEEDSSDDEADVLRHFRFGFIINYLSSLKHSFCVSFYPFFFPPLFLTAPPPPPPPPHRPAACSFLFAHFVISVFHHAAFIALLLCFITVQINWKWNHKPVAPSQQNKRARKESLGAARKQSDKPRLHSGALIKKKNFNLIVDSSGKTGCEASQAASADWLLETWCSKMGPIEVLMSLPAGAQVQDKLWTQHETSGCLSSELASLQISLCSALTNKKPRGQSWPLRRVMACFTSLNM